MTRAALAAFALAFAPSVASAAVPGVLKSVCDPSIRAAADDMACACAAKAAAAESAAAASFSDPDYTDWEDGFTLGAVTLDAVSDPGTDNCFELAARVNPGTSGMRNAFTTRLYRSMTEASVQFSYSPHFTKSNTDTDMRDDTVGGFISYGTETTTSGEPPRVPPGVGIITEFDPNSTLLDDEFGHSVGMVHTGGRQIEGAQTGDFNHDGLMDARVFLADGAILDLMGEFGGMEFWDISGIQ